MDTPAVSIIVPCKGRLEQLRSTLLPTLELLGSLNFASEVVVVDYDCPEDTAFYIQNRMPVLPFVELGQLQVLRVKDVGPHFSHARAVNIGVRHARGSVVILSGTDYVLSAKALTGLYTAATRPHKRGQYGRLINLPYVDLTGCASLTRELYAEVGGLEEYWAIEGWTPTDRDLYLRLHRKGLAYESVPLEGSRAIEHPQEDRAKYTQVKTIDRSAMIASQLAWVNYLDVRRQRLGVPRWLANCDREWGRSDATEKVL